jgi:hypothetical protein
VVQKLKTGKSFSTSPTKQKMSNQCFRLVTQNMEAIKESEFCFCVHCFEKYPASEVVEHTDGDAICPRCYVDAVIPDSCGMEITEDLLREWNREYFEETATTSTSLFDDDEEEDGDLISDDSTNLWE